MEDIPVITYATPRKRRQRYWMELPLMLAMVQVIWFLPAAIGTVGNRAGKNIELGIDSFCCTLVVAPGIFALAVSAHQWLRGRRKKMAGLIVAVVVSLAFVTCAVGFWSQEIGLHPAGHWPSLFVPV